MAIVYTNLGLITLLYENMIFTFCILYKSTAKSLNGTSLYIQPISKTPSRAIRDFSMYIGRQRDDDGQNKILEINNFMENFSCIIRCTSLGG
jgi:hypothetical protein